MENNLKQKVSEVTNSSQTTGEALLAAILLDEVKKHPFCGISCLDADCAGVIFETAIEDRRFTCSICNKVFEIYEKKN
jgi:hypothetical protein